MIDYVQGGIPTCKYCRRVPRDVRLRWINSVRDYMGLDRWTGETAEFLEVNEGVKRLDMHNSPPTDSRRASSPCFSRRRAGDSLQLTPQDVSYYPHTRGYLAASTGELVSRDTSHGSSRDGEAHASGSLVSPFPPRVELQPDLRGGPPLLSQLY